MTSGAKARQIRGYIQVVKIFIFVIGGILLLSIIIGENPVILLGGIGALSAVIMLMIDLRLMIRKSTAELLEL